MEIIRSIQAMKRWSKAQKREGRRIGFVPTMGYLHEGHLALVKRARTSNDVVVASIYVNPLQFGPKEDLARYPRDFEGDRDKLLEASVDILFYPSPDEMVPQGFQTTVDVADLSLPLCGAHRPGHFRGVATVVAALFNIVGPDQAFFGEKDYQQLQVVRRLVKDLHMPLEVVSLPTVRHEDGLAMSSRNVYLDEEARRKAAQIPLILERARKKAEMEVCRVQPLLQDVRAALEQVADLQVQYAEIVDRHALSPLESVGPGRLGVLAIAVTLGGVRLIDNITLGTDT